MCAVFQFKKRTFKPGCDVIGRSERAIERHVWAGFARNESLEWWLRNGGRLMELPVDRFAERSDLSRKLVWDNVTEGLFLRGVIHEQVSEDSSHPLQKPVFPLVKIITRAATNVEMQRFQHSRVPLIGEPLFGLATDSRIDQIFADFSSQESSQSELF